MSKATPKEDLCDSCKFHLRYITGNEDIYGYIPHEHICARYPVYTPLVNYGCGEFEEKTRDKSVD